MSMMVRRLRLEHLEGDVGLHLRHSDGIAVGEPRPLEGRSAEGIVALPAEGMPIADGEAQVILHALAEHLGIRVVPFEGQRLLRIPALEWDRVGDRKELGDWRVHVKASFSAG
jgi:hypothetical protein